MAEAKKENRAKRSCKKCRNLDTREMMCKAFDITVSSTANARYCKKYSEFTTKLPKTIRKKYKY